jgi:16S rRNA (guanine527-N7)-methyltransferase
MDTCRTILQQGLDTLELPYQLEHLDQLTTFIDLIFKWNRVFNLTAIRDPLEMARLHILDSLVVLPYLHGQRVGDIGTGAGLPGIPLAILQPEVQFSLVDSNAKKTRFVQQAVIQLGLNNVQIYHSRVEELTVKQPFSTLMMRAFASLPDILKLTHHLTDKHTRILAMKGQIPELPLDCAYQVEVVPLKVPGMDVERCLIQIEKAYAHG